MASKLTESNIKRAEELSGEEKINVEDQQKESLEASESEFVKNDEVEKEVKEENKFDEVEKRDNLKDSELEAKWENNNEKFREFENNSNREPYNATEEFREQSHQFAERLRADKQEQAEKIEKLREEQERLKKELDEMAEDRGLSSENYVNDKEFCDVLDRHTDVSEEIKETWMASKITESNIKRAEELSGEEKKRESFETSKSESVKNDEVEKEIKEESKFEEVEKGNKTEKEMKDEDGIEKFEKKVDRKLSKIEEISDEMIEDDRKEKELKKLVKIPYEKAEELARNEKIGENAQEEKLYARFFTEHGEKHVEMVKKKALEVAEAIQQGVSNKRLNEILEDNNKISLSGEINKKVLVAAALFHDVGMAGDGYKVYEGKNNYIIEKLDDNFNDIRKNHSLNSALYVLTKRNELKEIGYTDEDVNKIAVLCFSHSKSNSGIGNLNSKKDWEKGIEKLKSVAVQYEKDNPQIKLGFSDFEPDKNKLGELASLALSLRVGDVSRDSGEKAKSQSGEEVHVDKETVGEYEHSLKETEEGNARVILKGSSGDDIFMNSETSKRIHIGEQNIIGNHSYCENSEEYLFTHEIVINNADYAPESTIAAIKEHLGELKTAEDEKFKIKIKCNQLCSLESKKLYEDFASLYSNNEDTKSENIKIEIEFENN